MSYNYLHARIKISPSFQSASVRDSAGGDRLCVLTRFDQIIITPAACSPAWAPRGAQALQSWENRGFLPVTSTISVCDKMSDRETLLSMGFDPARVDCEDGLPFCVCSPPPPPPPSSYYFYHVSGALKATSNRGLQPAMDHLIANEGNPVPDLSSVSATPTRPPAGGDPMDEDEDLEALRAVYGTGGPSNQTEPEAKVPPPSSPPGFCGLPGFHTLLLEYQVQSVRKGVQEHRARKLPCGEERS